MSKKEINISDIINIYRNINKDIRNKENVDKEIKDIYYSNDITIIYEIKNEDEIKIFDKNFVENNKSKCNIIIDEQEQELCSILKLKSSQKKEKILEIILKGIQKVTNMSYMFSECTSLKSLPDISKWNTNNVTDMSYMFFYCESLTPLPDISKWHTNNVTNMSYMFSNCATLKSLPDISKWNTNNVTNMSWMFGNCMSITSLPDISKWNTNNATDMSYIFCNCESLISLPDISKWNTDNVTNMRYMFKDCKSLKYIPDISVWKINKNLDKEEMFRGVDKKIIPKKFKGCIILKMGIKFIFKI